MHFPYIEDYSPLKLIWVVYAILCLIFHARELVVAWETVMSLEVNAFKHLFPSANIDEELPLLKIIAIRNMRVVLVRVIITASMVILGVVVLHAPPPPPLPEYELSRVVAAITFMIIQSVSLFSGVLDVIDRTRVFRRLMKNNQES